MLTIKFSSENFFIYIDCHIVHVIKSQLHKNISMEIENMYPETHLCKILDKLLNI